MPTFRITDPTSGRTLKVTGDSPPTEQELEEIFASQPSAPTQQMAAQPAPAEPSLMQRAGGAALEAGKEFVRDAGRGLGLGVRSAVEGTAGNLAGIADLAAFPVNAAYRGITGAQNDVIPSYRQTLTGGLDAAGLPVPQSGAERVLDVATRGAAGAPLGIGGGQLLARSASPLVSGIGQTLAASPAAQMAAGASGGGSSQLAAEAGLSPEAQMLAGLAGGVAGGVGAGRIDAAVPARALPVGAATTAEEAAALRPAAAGAPIGAKAAGQEATREYKTAVDTLQRSGIDLTKGQVSGTNWLKGLERDLSAIPMSGKPLQRRFETQQQQYQKALLSKAGNARGDSMITRQTLDNTADDLSKAYTEALKGKTVSISSDDFLDDLATVEAKHSSFVDDPTKAKVRNVVNEFLAKAEKGDVDGEWYQSQRSLFAKRAKGTGELADLYGDLKSVLDDAFTRSAGGVKGDLDSRYARYSQLKKIWERSGGPAASEGFISPVAVAREAAGAPGGRAWQDFTRAGAAVIPDRLPNSGTAARQQAIKTMTLGASGSALPVALLEPMTLGALLGGAAITRGASSALARGQPLFQGAQSTISPLLYPSIQGSQ